MVRQGREYAIEREKALAEGVREVASELRLIEPADLVAYIRMGQFGNIRSLVNASTEMYFKPGMVRFGASGNVQVNWDSPPRIVLDMEFHNQRVDVFFRLMLEDDEAGVEIDYISFNDDNRSRNPAENTRRLIDAIADARIAPPAPAPSAASMPPALLESC